MMNKKICILTTVHPAFDSRIFQKEAKTLVRSSYDVTLIAQHNKNETVDGVKIIALPKTKSRLYRMSGLTLKALFLSLEQNADTYHFHDPELIPVGLALKLIGKKIIYDVHEDVPEQILTKSWVVNRILRKFVSKIFNVFEQLSSSFFTKIIVATPEIEKKFSRRKTTVIRNFPILGIPNRTMPANYKKDKPILIYAGRLEKIRGIKEIIQTMELVKDRAELWLLGKWDSRDFCSECKRLGGWKYTRYLGSKNPEAVYTFLKNADIGLCLLYPLQRYKVSLPTKAFEYMSCSLPIVMSNFPYWRKIFDKCALFTKTSDIENIANKILFLLNNPEKAKKLGYNGRQLTEKKFSWETEKRKLIDLYEHLFSE